MLKHSRAEHRLLNTLNNMYLEYNIVYSTLNCIVRLIEINKKPTANVPEPTQALDGRNIGLETGWS